MKVLANNVRDRIKRYAREISPHIGVEVQHGDVPNAPFFIADIVVTTLDQFLYGFARASRQVGHHIDIPAGSIASSFVVFDEAHMYRDGFTFSVMRALLEILYKSKVPFVVMTATMPKSLEKSLFENLGGFTEVQGDVDTDARLTWSLNERPLFNEDRPEIPEDLLKRIQQRKTLIVVSQVKRAQKIYDELSSRLDLDDGQIVLLHSRFTRADRQKHEEQAISLIPHKKEGKIVIPRGAGIVVSTQVLEAGIDFSAELLLTELAPADSLIQRAGRCARYNSEQGEIIIFPVEENRGYLPYEKQHLSKTLAWLQQNVKFNIRNFAEVLAFINETIDYKADDYEARDTLIDLYECVLYADTEPSNIQARKNKPVTLVVLDVPDESGEKVKKKIEEMIWGERDLLKRNSIDVDTCIAWSLFRDKNRPIHWEIQWKYDREKNVTELFVNDLFKNKRKQDDEDSRIVPFRTYIVSKKYYKPDKGIERDDSYII